MKLENFNLRKTKIPNGVQAILGFGQYELSIVQNDCSYGGDRGLYEIAVFKNGDQHELPGITAEGDTVKGFLTEQDVNMILKKMYLFTGNIPHQI